MIGVAVQQEEQEAAREFFELCKVPWEFYRTERQYQVVICTGEPPEHARAHLILLYGSESTRFDTEAHLQTHTLPLGIAVKHRGRQLPLYGPVVTFPASNVRLVCEVETQEPVLFAQRDSEQTVVRVGYNLFAEILFLLSEGQPSQNASNPTVELHIALLRDLFTRAGLPFVEIPPIPEDYALIVCLTHDVDHPLIRNHFFDHTMFGFLYRASIGSVIKAGRKKLSPASMWKNWLAVARLPFVYLGFSKDIWQQFDRYLAIEAGLGSTYFIIPKRDDPGRKKNGEVAAKRACRYELAELVPELKKVMLAGNEVGVHGLDAWQDAAAARVERALISGAVEGSGIGVRMHWLYFDQNSPATLDQAGFVYDSTVGYNETVGFRAGTAQAYRPLGADTLMELPLIAMDTALFYPDYLNLGEEEAYERLVRLLDDITNQGGALTINWHDRSIAPERLWEDFYLKIIAECKRRRAWFPTASMAIAWFKQRRQATISCEFLKTGELAVRGRYEKWGALPGLRIRIYKPCHRSAAEPLATASSAFFSDTRLDNTTEFTITI